MMGYIMCSNVITCGKLSAASDSLLWYGLFRLCTSWNIAYIVESLILKLEIDHKWFCGRKHSILIRANTYIRLTVQDERHTSLLDSYPSIVKSNRVLVFFRFFSQKIQNFKILCSYLESERKNESKWVQAYLCLVQWFLRWSVIFL